MTPHIATADITLSCMYCVFAFACFLLTKSSAVPSVINSNGKDGAPRHLLMPV
ncbi:hypothetical protein BDV29DRAFT_150060 [Aspergillus leporis]|uniref:Uncharacterized protein n=1 Tax=Aspergillus leporis TaxID=41062 RepID=A0A5N5WXU1_9EURO|nr:hypothetical protein BDV29DRAFT_150060 [Aspergillus leporis]